MSVNFVSFLAKPVTVGWGKKATQFHGSLGKPTAKTLKTEVGLKHPALETPSLCGGE